MRWDSCAASGARLTALGEARMAALRPLSESAIDPDVAFAQHPSGLPPLGCAGLADAAAGGLRVGCFDEHGAPAWCASGQLMNRMVPHRGGFAISYSSPDSQHGGATNRHDVEAEATALARERRPCGSGAYDPVPTSR